MYNETLHILIADDDEDDRLLFQMAIDKIKINTELSLFINGKELMNYINNEGSDLPELIFLDLNMPVKSGLECLRDIRKNPKFNNIVIAIYSTSSSESDIEETFISGANIYVNKPSDFETLTKVLTKVIDINWQYHTSRLDKDNFLFRI